MNCGTCKYWVKWCQQPRSDETFGDCRWDPPKVFQVTRPGGGTQLRDVERFVTRYPATRTEAQGCHRHKLPNDGKEEEVAFAVPLPCPTLEH